MPGTLAGYWEAHKMYGRLPWSRLILPTVALVERGVHVNHDLAYRLKEKSAEIKAEPSMRYKVTAMHQRISLYIPQYFPPGTSSTKRRAKLRRKAKFAMGRHLLKLSGILPSTASRHFTTALSTINLWRISGRGMESSRNRICNNTGK